MPKAQKRKHQTVEEETNQEEPYHFFILFLLNSPAKEAKHVFTPEELKAKIEKDKQSGRVIRCYADGIFDLFHYGHARVLEQCKKAFPNTYLLVGCCDDESTHRLKGKTVLTDEERYESLRHCKWVDEVIRGSPWVVTPEFIEKYNIDYVCHDSLPYATDGCDDIYENIRRMGKFYETQRTEGISTSDIIVRIIKDYDGFVRRNLSRGISAKEMNVPYVKEKTIQISSTLENGTKKIEETIKKGWHGIEDTLKKWDEKQNEFQDEFLQLFRKDENKI